MPLELKLPADLPEGNYTAMVCDDLTNARMELRDNPNLSNPQNLEQVFEALQVQPSAKRTNLVAARADQRRRRGRQRQVAAEPAAEHGADPVEQPAHAIRRRSTRPGGARGHDLGHAGNGHAALPGDEEQTGHGGINTKIAHGRRQSAGG